jgi:hypothetical protein
MPDFTLHHLLEDSVLLIDISTMNKIAPGDQYDDQEDDDRNEYYHEGH